MGLFQGVEELVKPTKQKNEAPENARREPGCDNCSLKVEWPRLTSPVMPISGNVTGDVLIFGEGPGKNEDDEGKAFVGDAGRFLREELPHRQLDRIAFTNAVRCRPPGNRTPTTTEVFACGKFFEEDIVAGNFKAVLGLGSVPLNKFIPGVLISNFCGVKFPISVADKRLWYYAAFHPSFVLRSGGKSSPQYPVFAADLRRFWKEIDKWPTPVIETPPNVELAFSEEKARSLVQKMKPPLGLDLETTCLRPFMPDAHILTASFSDGESIVAWPVEHPAAMNDWGLPLLLELAGKIPWCAHNLNFELLWLIWFGGVDWRWPALDDSMGLARLYFDRETILSLEHVSRVVLGTNVKSLTGIDAERLLDYDLPDALTYNGHDSWASVRILRRIKKFVNQPVYERLISTIQSTTMMERLGLPVDLTENRKLKEHWEGQQIEATSGVRDIYEVRMFEETQQKEFNIGSAQDVGLALVKFGKIPLPKTAKDHQYSTDDSVLQNYTDNPLVKAVLEHREARILARTFVNSVADENGPLTKVNSRSNKTVNTVDGLLHPSYNAIRVSTLRLSSSNPNIQNFPKRKHREMRRQVVAPPGHVIVAADSGQIQARIFGMASKDKNLCENFIKGEDIHTRWLTRIVDYYFPDYLLRVAEKSGETKEDKIWKAARDLIKSDFTFAMFFGSSAESASEGTQIPLSIVKAILEEFWSTYPSGLTWLKARRNEYRSFGGVTMLTGQFRHGVMTGNEPVITPIQNGESILIQDAQNELSQYAVETGDMALHPRIQIHDDLTSILPADDEDLLWDYIKAVGDAMNRVRYPWQIVPLTAEILIGDNWADLTPVHTFVGDYVR